MEIKVMSFNLRLHVDSDGENAWPNRVQAAATLIKKYDPLIIGTQEGFYAMLEDLMASTSGYAWIGEGRYGANQDEHNAILYKQDELLVIEQGQFWLSEHPETPASMGWDASHPRICTWAQFQHMLQPELKFNVYNTHLDHSGEIARINGATMILEHIQHRYRRDRLPFLLMGDFNSEPDSPVITYLRAQQGLLTDCYSVIDNYAGGTFHQFQGGADCPRIDYIFVSSAISARRMDVITGQVDRRYPSDHYPVLAEIELELDENVL